MCTAISFLCQDHYFGRNLDLEYHYQEAVTVTPRNYPFVFRNGKTEKSHYAMIGVATVSQNYPLYYEATNEAGLSVAGLNFPGNAVYRPTGNIAPFELIPLVLCQCKSTDEAAALLQKSQIAGIPFSDELPLTDLHWIISDKAKSITVEPLSDGLTIQENPVGVLTNNPPFDYHLHNMINYLGLSEKDPENTFAPQLPLRPYSRGMGAMGMPGDLSSGSRFVRAAFTKLHSVRPKEEEKAVSQFFHILSSVEQQEGCVLVGRHFEKTVYASCSNTDKGIYYYKTYHNSQLSAVHMHRESLDGALLVQYPLCFRENIRFVN